MERLNRKQKESIYFQACMGFAPSEIARTMGISIEKVGKVVAQYSKIQQKVKPHKIKETLGLSEQYF